MSQKSGKSGLSAKKEEIPFEPKTEVKKPEIKISKL